jgi:hypothetical protein
MPVRTFRVRCRDSRGMEHPVEVTAPSLYEGIAQALRAFRDSNWRDENDRDAAVVVVNVKQPQIEYKVRIGDFETWLDSVGKSLPKRV